MMVHLLERHVADGALPGVHGRDAPLQGIDEHL
jgi:hypothetical protein